MADKLVADKSLRGADGLRTLACLMVVFHHLSQELLFRPQIQPPAALKAVAEFFTSSGSAGVSVFFVLSGFLLAVPFWKAWYQGGTLPDLRVYAARRAGRILPGFSLNLLFFVTLTLLFEPQASATLARYFAGLTFTSGFHWVTFFPVDGNGPLWSIGFEVVSYVLLPLGMAGMFLVKRGRSVKTGLGWWLVVWLAVFAGNQLIQELVKVPEVGKGWQNGLTGGGAFWMPRYNPLGFFGHFSFGIAAAGLAIHWSRSTWDQTRTRLFDLLSLGFFVLWLGLLISRTNQDQFSWTLQGQPYYYPAFPLLSAALLACLTQSGLAARIFDNRFSRHTAQVSFGLYLWHTFVITRFNGAIGDTFEWLLLVALTLGLSYLIATLSWNHFEHPILKRVQQWRPGAPPPLRARPSRFPAFVALSAVVLVALPLTLAALLRPTAWLWPTAADTSFTFLQRGPVVGLTFDKGTAYVTKNGSEVFAIRADKTEKLLFVLPEEPAEVRLSMDVPKDEPLDTPTPGLSVFRSGQPWLWNLKLGPDGHLYVAAYDRVLVLTTEGQLLKTIAYSPRGPFGVMDVAFDPAGNLWASDGEAIFRDDRTTGERSRVVAPGVVKAQAAGLFFDALGTHLYLCDFDNRDRDKSRILAFPVEGGGIKGAPLVTSASGVLYGAQGPGGNLIFSGSFTGTLYRYHAGVIDTLWCPTLGPQTVIAFGSSDGHLAASGWNGTLGRIDLPGGPPP